MGNLKKKDTKWKNLSKINHEIITDAHKHQNSKYTLTIKDFLMNQNAPPIQFSTIFSFTNKMLSVAYLLTIIRSDLKSKLFHESRLTLFLNSDNLKN